MIFCCWSVWETIDWILNDKPPSCSKWPCLLYITVNWTNRKNQGYEAHTVYPKKYAHGFVVLCFVVVMQSFIMNSHEVFIHIHQGCFAGQWSKPDGYGKISQCITTTKHCKAKTVCIFLGYTVCEASTGQFDRRWVSDSEFLWYFVVSPCDRQSIEY